MSTPKISYKTSILSQVLC